jgi:CBS domain-containing protein
MKVRELMSGDVETCQPAMSLTDAAMAMWRRDCGFVPIVQPGTGKVAGVITDRDICIAVATRHEAPEKITVEQVMRGEVYTCRPDEDVRDALETMRQQQVRRLPVVDARESLVGILSINDVVRHAEPLAKKGRAGVLNEDVIAAFKAICTPRSEAHPAPRLPAQEAPAGVGAP